MTTRSKRPQVRPDIALMEGYHSPQVNVDVRLNTNEAPEPPPAEFTERLARELDNVAWHRYPDRSARQLRNGLAQHYGVDSSQVFAANGSNEVLLCTMLAYGGAQRTAAVFEPTYALHSHIARVAGTNVVEGERAHDFSIDLDEVRRVVQATQPEVVFLCSPNNPTGVVDDPATVHAVLELVAPYGGLVVVDEAYGQFAPSSAVQFVDDDTPLLVTRTFSKTWSMAAVRLGYCIGPSWLIDELDKVTLPYHLDVVKQIAGTLALEYRTDMDARVAQLIDERERLVAGLNELPVTVWPSGANFVLFRPHGPDDGSAPGDSAPGDSAPGDNAPGDSAFGDRVWQELVDRSVLVRNCSGWPRLAGCLRVTVGTREEDDRFLAALQEVLG